MYNSIIEDSEVGIITLNSNYEITYINEYMRIYSRLEPSKVLRNNIFNTYPELKNSDLHNILKKCFQFEESYKLKDSDNFKFGPSELNYLSESLFIFPVTHQLLTIIVSDDTVDSIKSEVLKKTEEDSRLDYLTQVYNRRYIETRLKEEFIKCSRKNTDLSVIMIDIDNFKSVNDTHGHVVGDTVLKEVSKKIKGALRNIDLLGRYGGEEFVLILPETNKDTSKIIAERVRKSVESVFLKYNDFEVKVTVSIGVSRLTKEDFAYTDVLDRADKALYYCKNHGKNQFCVFEEIREK